MVVLRIGTLAYLLALFMPEFHDARLLAVLGEEWAPRYRQLPFWQSLVLRNIFWIFILTLLWSAMSFVSGGIFARMRGDGFIKAARGSL